MKICKLKLKNLNSFRGEQEIDFESGMLSDASLVAITGPTGAGKTTLLDAICVALYGKTPRLSGTGSQHSRHLISHGEKEGFAEVHFVANKTGYVAAWSLKRGSSAEVRLSYAEDNKLISDKLSSKGKTLGSSQRTVSEEVESILGLDFDAFRRSVMLAQGEFAAFLKASMEDRRTILEATAGISIYEVLKQALNEKVAEVKALHAEVVRGLEGIPEASREQVEEAEVVFDKLQSEAEALDARSQQIQDEKRREEERKEDYERLQSLEDRYNELTNQQPEIDTLRATLENANRAQRLFPEKHAYYTAKIELEDAEKTLDTATTEKTDAEDQVKTDQADFDDKERAYQTASTEHKQKIDVYTNAKLDVGRAADQFAEADKRTVAFGDFDDEIDILSDQLTDSETEQTQLQKQIKDAQTFLDENPLPADRQHRLNRANVLSTQLDSQQKQLEAASTSEAMHGESVSALKREIKELSETREKRLSEKTHAKTVLKIATAELNKLLASGTREEWDTRKQQAVEAQPIAQKYETSADDLADSEVRLRELNEEKERQNSELEQIKVELMSQANVCQYAEKAVEHCENTRELALLTNPINKLRQHLHTGEPCLVCGGTEHPFAGIVESEDDNLLQNTEDALEQAKTELQTAQEQMQSLKTRQAERQRDTRNTDQQIEDCKSKIETLRNDKAQLLAQWQQIYPTDGVSSEWVAEQIEKVNTVIAVLGEAEQAQTAASHAYEMVAQQFNTCETDIAREEKSLSEVKKQLQSASDTVADLKVDIASTEDRFWEFLPKTFHGLVPKEAVQQFEEKIEEVATYQRELDSAESELKLLNAKIETDQNSLEALRKDRKELQAEMEDYRCQGETYLNTVREKTGGLETEDEINIAVEELESALKAKEKERDDAQGQLRKSRDLLTQKQTAHGIGESQFKTSTKKLETARQTYFDKLAEAGFDSPEAHNNAFRDDDQIQDLTDQIDDHEDKKQQLEVEIIKLRTRFEETPFDPEVLERIDAQVEAIGEQLQTAQQEVGAQQQKIDDLKNALEKRETLGDKLRKALQELERWQRLQNTIPDNKLRDFALEIMFKQMGSLANEQLNYLTSERYQLKVEGIGDLAVIDRWNANEERPVETLSGGESFLTSLALALALADLSRGRAQLNSLFLDEGFGTLDTETLDIAIAALEGLRMQGRSIFLISHIQELTRRLPVKINVRKQGNGSSSVDIRG